MKRLLPSHPQLKLIVVPRHPERFDEVQRTLAASGLALLGVAVMGGGALSGGEMPGDLLALAMTILMALMMVVIRRHREVSMLPAACLSALACAIVVLPLARPTAVTPRDFALLALFGTAQFGTGLLLLTIGSRLVSAPRASLLANLELPLAPLWVWLAFGEVPPRLTLVGGAVVCAAVLLDMAAGRDRYRVAMRKRRRKGSSVVPSGRRG